MKTEKQTSFAKRLSSNLIVSIAILMIVMLFIMAVLSHLIIADTSERLVANSLQSTIKDVEKDFISAETTVQNIAWAAHENLDDPDYLFYITRQTLANNPGICGCAIALREDYYKGKHFFSPYSYRDSQTGEVKTIQLGNEDYDYFYLDWFQIPYLLKKPVWVEPYFDEGGVNQLVSTYGYPILDESGNVLGIVTADISLERMRDMITSVKPYDESQIMLVSKCGAFVATDVENITPGETLLSYAINSGSKDIQRIVGRMINGETGMERYNVGSQISFVVFGQLSNGWSASITCLYDDVLKKSTQMHWFITVIGALALGLMFLFCKRAIGTAVTPIVDFSKAARTVAEGDFDAKLPDIRFNDEIRQLRNSFEEMQHSLKNYIADLKITTATKERMQGELHIAHEIQRVMSPLNFPKNDNLDLYSHVIPAREVGGDLYDFCMLDDSHILFTIGDVSGKGVPAAMFMALTCSSLRFASSLDMSIAQKLSIINDIISKDNSVGMFVTLFSGVLDINTGEFVYCNCGHNPIVVAEPGCKPRFLDQKPNMAVGVWEGFPFQEQRTTFRKGTLLVLYTDGVTEAEATDKSQYGEDRLLAWTAGVSPDSDAKTINDSLLENVRAFTDGNEQNDDITIMTIKI